MSELNTFDAILASLLESAESNPEMDIETLLVAKAKELGLSDKAISEIVEVNSFIDKIDDKESELSEVRSKGGTRATFITDSLESATVSLSDTDIENLGANIESFTESLIENNNEE